MSFGMSELQFSGQNQAAMLLKTKAQCKSYSKLRCRPLSMIYKKPLPRWRGAQGAHPPLHHAARPDRRRGLLSARPCTVWCRARLTCREARECGGSVTMADCLIELSASLPSLTGGPRLRGSRLLPRDAATEFALACRRRASLISIRKAEQYSVLREARNASSYFVLYFARSRMSVLFIAPGMGGG